MKEINITKMPLEITGLTVAIKSKIQRTQKIISVDGRHSDAFVYVLTGNCTYRFPEGRKFTAKAGDVLFLPYRSVYTMLITSEEYGFIFCDFSFSSQLLRSDCYSLKNPEKIKRYFQKLLSYDRQSFAERMSIIYAIYAHICFETQYYQHLKPSAKQKIEESRQYILNNISDSEMSVSALARSANMSEFHFRNLFEKQFGISPRQYILQIRVGRAEELMRYPFFTIKDCAMQSGFSTHQYFCSVFKKTTGFTPSEYRTRFQKRD